MGTMIVDNSEMSEQLIKDLRWYGFTDDYIKDLIRVIDILGPNNYPIGIYIDRYGKIIIYKY